MQKGLIAKLLTVTALTVVVLVVVGWSFGVFGNSPAEKTEASKADLLLNERLRSPAELLQEIAKYRQWSLVNPTPVLMDPAAAAMCAPLRSGPFDPHSRKYVSVYVNSRGAEAMMTQKHPLFPEGSIIVKEKLSDNVSNKPELLTVMVKHEKGYNPKSRDWEYLMVDGPATKFIELGTLSNCNECHSGYEDTDFVTMRYVNWKPKVN